MTKVTKYNRTALSVNHSLRLKVNAWFNGAQEWLFAPVCTLCGERGERGRDLCSGCADDFGFRTFRVVVIMRTDDRAANLVARLRGSGLDKSAFLVSSESQMTTFTSAVALSPVLAI